MEVYKTIKNLVSKTPRIAAIGIVAAMPYICESCGYSGKKICAGEVKQETRSLENPAEETLEFIVE